MVANNIIAEIQGLYKVVALQPFRKTEGVSFDILPRNLVPKVDAVDRVIHKNRAVSPGPVGNISEPWYMHSHQDDNLIVLQGIRYVEIYTKAHGRIESFIITPERIEHNNRILYDGPGLLVWPRNVFHRIKSGDNGSASINLATHYEGIDMKTNFNIYDVDIETGEFMVLREGHLDQTM
jgi:hypothetical protein